MLNLGFGKNTSDKNYDWTAQWYNQITNHNIGHNCQKKKKRKEKRATKIPSGMLNDDWESDLKLTRKCLAHSAVSPSTSLIATRAFRISKIRL